ncbi:MAG: metallophosphoesterase [Gammaproteobacteria bacterium]
MQIQYFSDVHLEFGAAALDATDADVIVAAGDIGVGTAAVDWLRASGKPTVYIAGNHEFYGGEVSAVQDALHAACAGTNVQFLERGVSLVEDVRFLGATLWTDFLGENAAVMESLGTQMNDYVHIRQGSRPLTPADTLQFNRDTRVWLEDTLATPHDGRTVVVTHHAPLFASWQQAPDSIFKGAYCNNLWRLVGDYRIDLWIHGHIHTRTAYRANTLQVVSNPRGYVGHQLVDGFTTKRTVTL